MNATDWATLLKRAKAQWAEDFDLLAARAPDDDRVRDLLDSATTAANGASEESAASTAPAEAGTADAGSPPGDDAPSPYYTAGDPRSGEEFAEQMMASGRIQRA